LNFEFAQVSYARTDPKHPGLIAREDGKQQRPLAGVKLQR